MSTGGAHRCDRALLSGFQASGVGGEGGGETPADREALFQKKNPAAEERTQLPPPHRALGSQAPGSSVHFLSQVREAWALGPCTTLRALHPAPSGLSRPPSPPGPLGGRSLPTPTPGAASLPALVLVGRARGLEKGKRAAQGPPADQATRLGGKRGRRAAVMGLESAALDQAETSPQRQTSQLGARVCSQLCAAPQIFTQPLRRPAIPPPHSWERRRPARAHTVGDCFTSSQTSASLWL